MHLFCRALRRRPTPRGTYSVYRISDKGKMRQRLKIFESLSVHLFSAAAKAVLLPQLLRQLSPHFGAAPSLRRAADPKAIAEHRQSVFSKRAIRTFLTKHRQGRLAAAVPCRSPFGKYRRSALVKSTAANGPRHFPFHKKRTVPRSRFSAQKSLCFSYPYRTKNRGFFLCASVRTPSFSLRNSYDFPTKAEASR